MNDAPRSSKQKPDNAPRRAVTPKAKPGTTPTGKPGTTPTGKAGTTSPGKAGTAPGGQAGTPPGEKSNRGAAAPKVRPVRARTPALESLGVSKSYGELTALSPLDLVVEQGEAVVLIGHNGSGKTTLLRMAAGLLESSDGSIEVGGHPAGSLPARAALSYLSDSPTFYDDLSVWEHLEFTARLHGLLEWEQSAADVLDHLGIYARADDLPARFSRGLKQKAAIALALIRPMDLLIVDEPFIGLDAAGKAALLELLDDLHAQGTALVVCTHELEFVTRVSRCVALRDGELVHDGPIGETDVLSLVSG